MHPNFRVPFSEYTQYSKWVSNLNFLHWHHRSTVKAITYLWGVCRASFWVGYRIQECVVKMYGYHIIVHFTIDIYNRIAARSSIIREHTNIVIYSCQWKWWMALKHWCFQLVWYCWYVQPQEIQQRKKGSYLQELLFKGHESSVTWAYQHSDCQNAARVFIFASGWIKTSPEMMHIYIYIYIYM